MTDDIRPATVRQEKQEVTSTTYARAGAAAASVALAPQLVVPILKYIFMIVLWVAPTFPSPDTDGYWSIACIVCAVPAFWASFSIRGTRAERRSTDATGA